MALCRFLLLFLAWLPMANAATLTASLDRSQMHIGESVHLTLQMQGESSADPDLTPLTRDFEIVNQQQSSSIRIVNGTMSRSVQWQIELMPRRTGRLSIPAIRAGQATSAPLSLQVMPENSAGASPPDDVFLELELSSQDVYVQQQVLLSVRVFRSLELSQAQLSEPEIPQATLQRLGEDSNYQTTRSGKTFVVTERRYALFPQQHGELTIPALQLNARVGTGVGLFARPGRLIRRHTPPRTIHVRPVPANWPTGYTWLPASKLTLQANKLPDHVVVGDALTRTIRLQAHGLMAAQLPELALNREIHGLRQYPDKPELSNQQGADGIIGLRQQGIALMPGKAGDYRLDGLRIPWWNTARQQLAWAELPAQVLHVEADPAAATPAPSSPAAVIPAQPAAAVELPRSPDSQAWPGWFWLSLLFAFAWLLTLWLWLAPRWRQQRLVSAARNAWRQREKSLRQQAIRACRENNARAAAQHLLQWSQQAMPDVRAVHLMQLADRLEHTDPRWRPQLAALDAALYAPAPHSPWNGKELAELLAQANPVGAGEATTPVGLPELYPVSASGR